MARTNRVKAEGAAYYHVIDRIAHKAFLLESVEVKRALLDFLYRSAEFSGMKIVTYAVMDNHLHLCVHAPKRQDIREEEVLRRIGILYGEAYKNRLCAKWEALRASGKANLVEMEIMGFRLRMGDLSAFMKTFKQRMSQWFNGVYGHEGALWSGRFKSVLVEQGVYLRTMVNYIHSNPVRAGLVSDMKDYRWNGLGAAARGDARALKGLSLIGLDLNVDGICYRKRDKGLVNGVIVGGHAFVARAIEDHGMCFRARPLAKRLASSALYASHGSRSRAA